MKFLLKVTQEHIDKGITNSCDFCPIALALKDLSFICVSVPGDDGLFEFPQPITFWIDSGCDDEPYRIPQVTEIEEFIEKFDNEEKVEPFEIEVETF